jgi:hypothetical protein
MGLAIRWGFGWDSGSVADCGALIVSGDDCVDAGKNFDSQ